MMYIKQGLSKETLSYWDEILSRDSIIRGVKIYGLESFSFRISIGELGKRLCEDSGVMVRSWRLIKSFSLRPFTSQVFTTIGLR